VAESTTYIQPLNGHEIVDDLCGLIADKLRSDCNLREIDGYSSGYKAKVTIHLEAFGLDTAVVDQEISVDESTPDAANPLQEPDEVIDTEIEVEQEPDLSAVRERSGQSEPNIEISAEGPIATGKRKYTRRLKALAAAQGGATEVLDE